MSTQIDSLSIEIKSSARSASKAIDALVASLQKLDSVKGVQKNMKKISDAVSSVGSKFNSASRGADNFAGSASRAARSTSKLGSSMKGATSGVKSFLAGVVSISAVSELISESVKEAKDWSGISARFGEGFGAQADEAYAHVQKLSDALMINDQAFMQYAGNFATLAKGFGVVGKNVSAMSIGLTVCVFYLFLKSRLNKQSTPCIEFLGRHSVWFCLLHVLPWVLWQQM